MSDQVLRKIQSVSVAGFRGFVKERQIDTDADIVLVAGPNGFGKTSLLQALQLLLTGHHDFNDPADLFSVSQDPSTNGAGPQIRIQAKARFGPRHGTGTPSDRWLNLEWTRGEGEAKFALDEGAWPRLLRSLEQHEDEMAEEKTRARELLARVTTFYPERVEGLFRNLTTGASLRDIFYPMPEPVRKVLDDLDKREDPAKDPLQKMLDRVSHAIKPLDELEKERFKAEEALAERWRPLRLSLPALAARLVHAGAEREVDRRAVTALAQLQRPSIAELGAQLQVLKGGAAGKPREIAAGLMDQIVAVVDREIVSAKKEAREIKGAEGLFAEKVSLEAWLTQIGEAFPRLDQELGCFEGAGEDPKRPDLLALFRGVAEDTEAWRTRAKNLALDEQAKLRAVLLELDAVVPENARMRAQELDQWLAPRREAHDKREGSQRRIEEIDRLLEQYRQSEDVEKLAEVRRIVETHRKAFQSAFQDLDRAQLRIEKRAEIERCRDDLKELANQIHDTIEALETATGATAQINQHVAKLANSVLGRFSMVEGVLPVKVRSLEKKTSSRDQQSDEPHSEVRTKSNLLLSQLSTGQRAQMAVALAVAQGELLRASQSVDLPFYQLLLDDVSTAYDLSNLTREAVLWRQLAYNEKPEQRWQIFIASHHEDLTNHLLDLLVPPEGASMHVIRFTGWSPEEGPEIESFAVEPSVSIDKAREAIKATFREELCLAS